MTAGEELQRRTDTRRAVFTAAQCLLDALNHLDRGDDARAERSMVAAAGTLAPVVGALEREGSL